MVVVLVDLVPDPALLCVRIGEVGKWVGVGIGIGEWGMVVVTGNEPGWWWEDQLDRHTVDYSHYKSHFLGSAITLLILYLKL